MVFAKFLRFFKKEPISFQDERDWVGLTYLLKREKIKCERLQEKIDHEILDQEEQACFLALREQIQLSVNCVEWESVQHLGVAPFILHFQKMLEQKKWKLEEKSLKKCDLCITRILQIEKLKNEMHGRMDLEKYYQVITKLNKAKSYASLVYLKINELTEEARQLIDRSIQDQRDLGVDHLVKYISAEVGKLVQNKVATWDDAQSLPVVDIDIGIQDIQNSIVQFKALQELIEAPNLCKYIQSKRI